MSVGAYASYEEVYAAGIGYHLLVVAALCVKVFGVAVEDMYVLFGAVYVLEEVLVHE